MHELSCGGERVTVRPEEPGDCNAVRGVLEHAFGQVVEADVADKLRDRCLERISLVAVVRDRVVGHVLFTPVVLEGSEGAVGGMGLGPMAVLPQWQRRGIGSRLVEGGLEVLRARRCPFVVVLGHPAYYPRFGFEPASTHRVTCPWGGVPDAAYMILVLDERAMPREGGVARYRDEFDAAV